MTNAAVGYVRVSTEEQAREGVSLNAQEQKLRAYCALMGLELVELIREEGVSGARPLVLRPGGERLAKLVAAGKVEHVVALKLDRLFRDAEDALCQTKAWDKAGVALHLVDMGGQTINTASAMGRFFLSMMASFAELERNLIAERTQQALQHKKASGKVYGQVPYGLRRVGDRLEPDPREQAIIARIIEAHRNGKSLRVIARELEAEGVATKQGGKWTAGTVHSILANNLPKQEAA
jgi:DNA invertase Pin-like site-specific DNA recombinase